MAKKDKQPLGSVDDGPDRPAQVGAVTELAWFFIATVGSFIRTGDCNHEAAHEAAAEVRKHAEQVARDTKDLFW